MKYERVYLKAYDSVSAARTDIADYLGWYNAHRSHSSLDGLTPDDKYLAALPPLKLARKMKSPVRPELPTASVGSSQAPTAAVDNSAPSVIRTESTYKSGNVVQTSGATSQAVFLSRYSTGLSPCNPSLMRLWL